MFGPEMNNEQYIDFIIKGNFDKTSKIMNFFEYIFGYEENIKFNEIYETDFFKSDYFGSSIDKLFPLSSMPKNGDCFKNTFLNKKTGDVQVHMMLEEDDEQYVHLINSISLLMENDDVCYSCYINENMIVHDIYEIKNNIVTKITMDDDEAEYKSIWNSNFKNIGM